MQQYNAIKTKYPDALLLFRVGDFYETFGQDAIQASKILDIILTKRGAGSQSETELAGFPHHSLNLYLPKLVKAGHRVAICDQLEDPKKTKKIVKRGVTELVTPGLASLDGVLNPKKNNFLASIYFSNNIGISFLDISTGEFLLSQGDSEYIAKLLSNFSSESAMPVLKEKLSYFDESRGGLSTIIEFISFTSVELIFSSLISAIQNKSESILSNLFPNLFRSEISLISKFAKINDESSWTKLFK